MKNYYKRNEQGAATILIAMMVMLITMTFISNTTNKLDSILDFKLFLDKNEEIKKITKEIEDILSSRETCNQSINALNSKINYIKDADGVEIFITDSNKSTQREEIYKQIKLVAMEIPDSSVEPPKKLYGKGSLDLYFAYKATLDEIDNQCKAQFRTCNKLQKKSMEIWIQKKGSNSTNIENCSTAPPAIGTLNCEPIEVEFSCCLFIYYIKVPEEEIGAKKAFRIDDPKNLPEGTRLNLIVEPASDNRLMRTQNPENRGEGISIRMTECDPGTWNESYKATIQATCENGSWNWSGTCT